MLGHNSIVTARASSGEVVIQLITTVTRADYPRASSSSNTRFNVQGSLQYGLRLSHLNDAYKSVLPSAVITYRMSYKHEVLNPSQRPNESSGALFRREFSTPACRRLATENLHAKVAAKNSPHYTVDGPPTQTQHDYRGRSPRRDLRLAPLSPGYPPAPEH